MGRRNKSNFKTQDKNQTQMARDKKSKPFLAKYEDSTRNDMIENRSSVKSVTFIHRKIVLLVILVAITLKWTQDNYSDTIFVRIQNFRNAYNRGFEAQPDKIIGDQRLEKFLSWVVENGGYISPSVTISYFPDFGGFGLMAITPPSNLSSSPTELPLSNTSYAVKQLDTLFKIPDSIITNAQSVVEQYDDGRIKNFRNRLNHIIKSYFQSSMVEQDVIIALHLMTECSLGGSSRFKHYLDVLPKEIVPRLDTFDEEELAMIQDKQLSFIAKQSYAQLRLGWKEGGLVDLVSSMAKIAMYDAKILSSYPSELHSNVKERCLSFDTFHKYVTIVSSRSMVLKGTKWLTPLADMANYAPRNGGVSFRQFSQSFALYHEQNSNDGGSITVRADRNVRNGEQIFEDYGDTDNSLFLEAHGFVPDANPFHCAVISPEYLPRPFDLPQEFWGAMVKLRILPPSQDRNVSIPDICVKADGNVSDDRAQAYLALSALAFSPQKQQKRQCIASIELDDIESAMLQCVQYSGYLQALKLVLLNSARLAMCTTETSLQEDLSLLDHLVSKEHAGLGEQRKKILALKFRISDKRILYQIGAVEKGCSKLEMEESTIDNDQNTEFVPSDVSHSMQESSHLNLNQFNDFLQRLNIAERKIDAKYFGNGMRLGVVATDDIAEGESYFSINSNSVISMDTAVVDGEKNINILLNQTRLRTDDGGLKTIIIYLMYEKFVRKEESKWYPYLQLLPSVGDMKRSFPLFFDDAKLSFLAGSDLRRNIVEYKRKVETAFAIYSSDYNVVSTLGAEVMKRDNFMWAYGIIDSRSIWWDGKRHLVPLLDLVNCLELRKENGTVNAPHQTMQDSTGNAVTKATASFKKGDQIVENYGQPNYIYFMYHGFVLENNSHDCALWKGLSIESADEAAKNMVDTRSRLTLNGFSSSTLSPSFCISDIQSLGKVADFLRIKHGIKGGDNQGLAADIIGRVMFYMKQRIRRYELNLNEGLHKAHLFHSEKTMFQLVSKEKEFFESAYKSLEAMV